MKVKNDFFRFGTLTIKDGAQIRFWEDKWLGNSPLRDQYPCLYNIVRLKHTTVAAVLQSFPPVLSWRRDLVGPKLVAWNSLFLRIANITLTPETDVFR